jgi:hypothetical protein
VVYGNRKNPQIKNLKRKNNYSAARLMARSIIISYLNTEKSGFSLDKASPFYQTIHSHYQKFVNSIPSRISHSSDVYLTSLENASSP